MIFTPVRFKLVYVFKILILCNSFASLTLQASYYHSHSQNNSSLHQAARDGNLDEVLKLLRNTRVCIDSMRNDGYTALHLAVKNDHLLIAQALLQQGANVNATVTRSSDKTALDLALKDYFLSSFLKKEVPNIEMIELLLNHGATVGDRLQDFVRKGDIEMMSLFLKHNKSRNLINEPPSYSGDTLLHTALHSVSGGWGVGKSSGSPIEMVKLLLNFGADVNKPRTHSLETPLHTAVQTKNSQIIDQLLQKKEININVKNKDLRTPLHLATDNKLTNVVASLLNKRALINEQDKDGRTALHLAVQARTYRSNSDNQATHSIVQLLIEAQADVNIKDKEEKTALHYAAKKKDVESTNLLISKQASINSIDNENCTPLHYVFARGYHYDKEAAENKTPIYNIVVELLAKGAELNHQSKDQSTPLHQALRYPHPEAATLLIEKGADVNALDNKGDSPLYLAVVNQENHVLLGSLLKREAHDNKCFEVAWKKRLGNIVKLLLDNGFIPQPFSTSLSYSSKKSDYSSPLDEAAKRKDWRITKYLLEHGALVENHIFSNVLSDLELEKDTLSNHPLLKNLRKKSNKKVPSPSTVSSQRNYSSSIMESSSSLSLPSFRSNIKKELNEIIVLLLQYGADPNAKNSDKQLPLEIAFEEYMQPLPEIISMLRIAGANLYETTASDKPFIQTLSEQDIKKYLGNNIDNIVPSLKWQALKRATQIAKGNKELLQQIEEERISLLPGQRRLYTTDYLKEFLDNSVQYHLKIRTDKYPLPPLRWLAIQAVLNGMKENPRRFFYTTLTGSNQLSPFECINNNNHIKSEIQFYTDYSWWEEKYNLPVFEKSVIRPGEYPLEDYLNLWLQEKSPYESKTVEKVSYRAKWEDDYDYDNYGYGYSYRDEEWEAEENARWYKSYDDVYVPD